MSQKTNPISLRLQRSNKHFESCWYSDFFYGQVLSDEINLRAYIEGLLSQAGRSKTLPSIQSQYKRYCTSLFFLDQRAERHKREFSLKLSREPAERVTLPRTKFLQGKKKTYISAWIAKHSFATLLFNQVQDVLRKGEFSKEEKYKYLTEKVTRKEELALTQNGKQEYLYRYAIKSPFSKLFLLAGLDSTKFYNTKLTQPYNSVINPGLKPNLFKRLPASIKGAFGIKNNPKVGLKTNPKVDSYIQSKDSFGVSLPSFALLRVIPYTHRPVSKRTALESCSAYSASSAERSKQNSTTQTFDWAKVQAGSEAHTASKAKDTVFLKARVIKESTVNTFSMGYGRENLFRALVIARCSQSVQNRLSFWFVKGLEEQVRTFNISSPLDNKSFKDYNTFTPVNTLEKTELRNRSVAKQSFAHLVPQKWQTKPLGLARHTELFLNTYSGNFLYHTIQPVRAISPFQSADFLLESIAYLLQRKSSFRQIKDDIFRELDQYQLIKGARLSCAGRLGGRSKKAQKAKTQTAQWGETSLTVFSSRLAFSSKGVKTTYGKVGVKLWLCYR